MNLLLLAGLLLPWATGCLWLAAFRQYQGHAPHTGRMFRLAGYGFFLGYALLYIIIIGIDTLTGKVSLATVFFLLTAAALAGTSLLVWLRRAKPLTPAHPDNGTIMVRHERFERILTALLLTWAVVHLLFAIVDVLSIPVYPWDAWLVWMYRAKAWFFSGGLVDIVSPSQWAAASSVPPYSVSAWAYPDYLSVIAFWAAACLGHWSETLVNLPGLLCGLAIGLTLYGHTRRLGLRPIYAVAACYLLFSTPLFGAHLAMGGYADIWMAGFAGLGFVALLSGLGRHEWGYTTLGLALLFFSALVKNEGAVWALAAVALTLVMTVRTRTLLIAAGALIALMALTNTWWMDIPVLGITGFKEGRIHIPMIGVFALEIHNVWREFLVSFFVLGSWHALWLMAALTLMLALRHSAEQEHKVALGFLLVFAASQIFIFGFTDQAKWAAQYTAINRLPLQFLPALLFAMALVWSRTQERTANPGTGSGKPGWATIMALVLVILGAVGFLARESTKDAPDPTLPELQFVMGDGTKSDSGIDVHSYQQGFALLSSGPVELDAESFPFLVLEISAEAIADPDLAPAFFWRSAEAPENVSRLTLDYKPLQDLSVHPDWTGTISEFGLLVPDAGYQTPLHLRSLALEPRTLASNWKWTRQGWLAFEPWSLRSINFIWGGAETQLLWLPVLTLAWAVLTMLLFRVPAIRPRQPATFSLVVVMIAWMALDIRWTLNGARQMAQSVSNGFSWTDEQRLAAMPEADIMAVIERFRAKTNSDSPARIIVVGSIYDYEYYLQRAKYHLLPDSAAVTNNLNKRFNPENVDYVLFVGDFASPGANWAQIRQQLPMSEGWRNRVQLADSEGMAILMKVDN